MNSTDVHSLISSSRPDSLTRATRYALRSFARYYSQWDIVPKGDVDWPSKKYCTEDVFVQPRNRHTNLYHTGSCDGFIFDGGSISTSTPTDALARSHSRYARSPGV